MTTIDTPLDPELRYFVFVEGASCGSLVYDKPNGWFVYDKLNGWFWYKDGVGQHLGVSTKARRAAYDLIGHAEHCQESDIALLVIDDQARD
jgi:hypothetical protein